MLNWIKDSVGNITGWLGDKVGAFFGWVFDGLAVVVTKAVEASSGFFKVLDAIFDFAFGFINSVINLFGIFFPFVPAPVIAVIGMGLIAILLAGFVKKVRGK